MNKWILLLGLGLLAPSVIASEIQLEGLVNLQAGASLEVETDTMQVTIAVEAENYDPTALAENINKDMAWALDTAKSFKTVKIKGGQYTSHQIHNKRMFKAWRGSQTITLESKNSVELGRLVGQLQKRLLVKSLRYFVSKEKLASVKKVLVKEAIENFKNEALVITKSFDKSEYVLHRVNVNNNHQRRPDHYASSRMMLDSAMVKSTPANLQKSTSNVQININGTIRLIK